MRVRFVQPLIAAYRVPFYRALAASGVDVEVWAGLHSHHRSLDGIESDPHFRCVDAPYRELGPLVWQPRMRQAAREPTCDCLVLGGNVRQAQLLSTLGIARRRRLPTLLWLHGTGRTGSGIAARLRRRALALSTAAVCYSERVQDDLAREGVEAARRFVAPNSIDQSPIRQASHEWTADPSLLARFRSENQLDGRIGVLYLARLEPDKRADLLVDAIEVLRDRPEIVAILIGKGTAEGRLRQRVAARGLSDRVRFLGGLYDDRAIAPWALSSSMLVHPGGIGLTVFHAFGYGLPIITSQHGAAHGPEFDAIEDGHNGIVVPFGTAESLAAAIRRLVDDHDLRRRLSEAASATVTGTSGYSIEAMVAGFRAAISFAVTHGAGAV